MKGWKKKIALVLSFVILCLSPLTALAEGESNWPNLSSVDTTKTYGEIRYIWIDGERYYTGGGTRTLFTPVILPDGMDTTFEIEAIEQLNSSVYGNVDFYPAESGAADFYYPVPYTAAHEDGRSHRIYIMAGHEKRAFTEAEGEEWLELAPLMISYRDAYNALIEKLKLVIAQDKVEVGGYHPAYLRMLNNVLNFALWPCVDTNELAAYGQTVEPYTEESLRAEMETKVESGYRYSFTPEQLKKKLTVMGDYYLDLVESGRIDEPELSSFSLGPYQGVVDGAAHVTISIPEEVDLESLGDPVVSVEGDVKAVPFGGDLASGKLLYRLTPFEITTGVLYDGIDTSAEAGFGLSNDLGKTWVVKIERGDPLLRVTSFSVTVNGRVYEAQIDEEKKSIFLRVPEGTDIAALEPELVHTAESYELDGEKLTLRTGDYTREYTVEIRAEASPECEILSYQLCGVEGEIDGNRISLTLPYGTDLEGLAPELALSDGASLAAQPESLSYGSELSYVVRAESGAEAAYTVVLSERAAATGRQILSFSYGSSKGVIDQDEGTISLTVPAGTNVRSLAPAVEVSEFASVSPASGEAADFSSPVSYTVTSQAGSRRTYQVSVTAEEGVAENPYEASMQTLVNNIVARYRTTASDDWEWMDIGFYDNKERSSASDLPAGFDLYAKLKSLKLGSAVEMTEYGRFIMTLTALGVNASDLTPYGDGSTPLAMSDGTVVEDLTERLYDYAGSYTINGPVFGLIALDMGNYTVPEGAVWSRARLLETILAHPYGSDGFGIDMVGAIMYSIAPYQDDAVYGEQVRAKLQEGLEIILGTREVSGCSPMNKDYTFGAWGAVNSESAGWVIAGLCSMGIDCHTDPRFSDGEGNSVLTKYLEFADVSGGYFAHTASVLQNAMATYQGCYVTQWYLSFLEKQRNVGAGTPCYFYYQRFDFERELSSEAKIEEFSLEGQEGEIDQDALTITVTLPKDAPLSRLTPELTLSRNASLLSPELPVTFVEGTAQPFTVQAEDRQTTQTYQVTVVRGGEDVLARGARLDTGSIKLLDENQREVEIVGKSVEETEKGADILLTVTSGIDVTKLALEADLSYGASADISLDGQTLYDLGVWLPITVTSQSGQEKGVYRIKAQPEACGEITEFSLAVGDVQYPGVIEGTKITVSGVPSTADVTAAVPTITFGEGTTASSPLSGVPQDFSSPVSYTVSGEGLKARTYTVTVVKDSGTASDPSVEDPSDEEPTDENPSDEDPSDEDPSDQASEEEKRRIVEELWEKLDESNTVTDHQVVKD